MSNPTPFLSFFAARLEEFKALKNGWLDGK